QEEADPLLPVAVCFGRSIKRTNPVTPPRELAGEWKRKDAEVNGRLHLILAAPNALLQIDDQDYILVDPLGERAAPLSEPKWFQNLVHARQDGLRELRIAHCAAPPDRSSALPPNVARPPVTANPHG